MILTSTSNLAIGLTLDTVQARVLSSFITVVVDCGNGQAEMDTAKILQAKGLAMAAQEVSILLAQISVTLNRAPMVGEKIVDPVATLGLNLEEDPDPDEDEDPAATKVVEKKKKVLVN